MFQTNEQDKMPEIELSEVEQPIYQKKSLIVKMFKEHRRKLNEQSKNLEVHNKELENAKKTIQR